MPKYTAILLLAFLFSCDYDPNEPDLGRLDHIEYEPKPVSAPVVTGYPLMEIPADNPLTEQGILLGKRLFFDPILSRDSSLACAGCHKPELSFTDGLATSKGIDGLNGKRSAMSLIDIGFQKNGLFWDGRSHTLEQQALLPVEDVLEMHFTWPEVIDRIKKHKTYPGEIRKAFGIVHIDSISKYLITKAIAQFERTLVSSGRTKYDLALTPGSGVFFTEGELRGFDMYFDRSGGRLPDAECFHCHNSPLMASNDYFNNGIQKVTSLNDFEDLGRGKITGAVVENGQFRAPTLRNIALTAPYMHDGRFKSLTEVIEHYNSGGHPADNKNPFIRNLKLTETQKMDLIAFLHTLTDSSFVKNPAFRNPF
jgi:cytochrome c peroxidase